MRFSFKLSKHALLLIDLQQGFWDQTYWGPRNNPALEENVKSLLSFYRAHKLPVLHVQHVSTELKSPLRPGQSGVEFMPTLAPQAGEPLFQKSVNSAFIGTNLESYLKDQGIESLTLVGLTSDHCVSTSARMGANLGFQIVLPSDCTATFDRKNGSTVYPAELVHEVSLASLQNEFAEVVTSIEIKTHLGRAL